MNWLVKISGSIEEYLTSLGATPDIVQFIMSVPDGQQFLTNEFRKNPTLTLEQMQEIVTPQKQQPAYTDLQLKTIDDAVYRMSRRLAPDSPWLTKYKNWLTVEFRKLNAANKLFDYEGNTERGPVVYYDPTGNHSGELIEMPGHLDLVRDWIIADEPELASYSFEQALQAQEDYHDRHDNPDNVYYDPISPQNIIYGPEWNNPKWKGWTIQEISSENDLTAESNLMNHCVDSYWRDIQAQRCVILSLRDPQNKPHVTAEKDYKTNTFYQIMANSNDEPEGIHKEMFKEWFNTLEGVAIEGEDAFDYNNLGNNQELEDTLHEAIYGGGAYGIAPHWDQFDVIEAYDATMYVLTGNDRDFGYYHWMGRSGDTIAQAAVDHDIWLKASLARGYPEADEAKQQAMFYSGSAVEKLYQKMDEGLEQFVHNNFGNIDIGIPYPQEEDFETPEEYEQAIEKHHDQEAEYMQAEYENYLPGALNSEIAKEIVRLKDKTEVHPKLAQYNWLQLIRERI